jgi:glycerol-3-phosphate acyltransferase PlsY
LDIAKGTIPVLIGKWVGLGNTTLAAVALLAVLGHDFSFLLRFRGGKGVATTLGVSLALAPMATLVSSAIWLIILATFRYSSLASLVALALLPFGVAVTGQPAIYVGLEVALFLLAAFKHRKNVIRLIQGTELKTLQRQPSDAG